MEEEVVKTPTVREQPEIDPADEKLVKTWLDRIEAAKTFWKKPFERMRRDMEVARLGADGQWIDDGNYVVPLVKRQINQAVATIYAKNPTFKVEPRRRLRYKVWDGSSTELKAAMAGMLPNAQAIVADVIQAETQEKMLKRVCKTAEILLDYYINEQDPNFKLQMKALVRRVKTCGVGYLWLDYQRILEKRPEAASQIDDMTSKLQLIDRESADLNDGEIQMDDAEAAELQSNVADLEGQGDVIAREGLVFDFIRSDELLIDPKVRQIKGFIGARWIDRYVHMHPDEVQEVFGIDLKKAGFNIYRQTEDGKWNWQSGSSDDGTEFKNDDMACVHYVYDKKARQNLVVCEGYKGWLKTPGTPEIETERFWPAHPLVFGEVEDPKGVIPPSFASDMQHPQSEYNRQRQALREHRIANRPAYLSVAQLEDEDKKKLVDRPAHAVLELKGATPGMKAEDILTTLKPAAIDPALYNTNEAIEDINRGAGSQDSSIGMASGDITATESSIADASRSKSDQSDIDDIDEFMTAVGRDAVQILLLQLTEETAKKIAGPGAVWPSLNRGEIVEELTMKIKAGSSGRPNAAAKLANFERAWPMVSQLPGVNPEPLVNEAADLLDIDVEELYAADLPSIVAANAMQNAAAKTAATPNNSQDPNQQGSQGAANQEQPPQEPMGPQPAYPTSADAGGAMPAM